VSHFVGGHLYNTKGTHRLHYFLAKDSDRYDDSYKDRYNETKKKMINFKDLKKKKVFRFLKPISNYQNIKLYCLDTYLPKSSDYWY
jgi:hypothetical protein